MLVSLLYAIAIATIGSFVTFVGLSATLFPMQDNAHILIIEDDLDINEVVAVYLRKRGFLCTQAFSGSEARLLLERANEDTAPFDLVITDLMLPGMTGQQIVELIRSRGNLPVIVASALQEPAQKVGLFELGADDYLTKPFDLEELLARVLVQLRHAAKIPDAPLPAAGTRFKEWTIDFESRSFMAANTQIKLTRTEYNIVETLMRRPTRVFSKRELYESVWNEDSFIEEKAINVHISNIRSKLKDTGTSHYIETVWGIGFKLCKA